MAVNSKIPILMFLLLLVCLGMIFCLDVTRSPRKKLQEEHINRTLLQMPTGARFCYCWNMCRKDIHCTGLTFFEIKPSRKCLFSSTLNLNGSLDEELEDDPNAVTTLKHIPIIDITCKSTSNQSSYAWIPSVGFSCLSSGTTSMPEAQNKCKTRGMLLASPSTNETQIAIQQFLKVHGTKEDEIWVDVRNEGNSGTFKWSDGTCLEKENFLWANGKPDGNPTELCARFQWKEDPEKFLLNDIDCKESYRFLCVKPLQDE